MLAPNPHPPCRHLLHGRKESARLPRISPDSCPCDSSARLVDSRGSEWPTREWFAGGPPVDSCRAPPNRDCPSVAARSAVRPGIPVLALLRARRAGPSRGAAVRYGRWARTIVRAGKRRAVTITGLLPKWVEQATSTTGATARRSHLRRCRTAPVATTLKIGERGARRDPEKARRAIYRPPPRRGEGGLVEQNRPNLFRTSVANVGPGETVSVRIAYWQAVAYRDGHFAIDLPLGLTSRYVPATTFALGGSDSPATGLPPENAPEALPAADAATHVDQAPMPVGRAHRPHRRRRHSTHRRPTHPIQTRKNGERYVIALHDLATLPERDFELRWTRRRRPSRRARCSSRNAPMRPTPTPCCCRRAGVARRLPRELILVIRYVGSMQGDAIVRRATRGRGAREPAPGDRFNLIQFNSSPSSCYSSRCRRMTSTCASRPSGVAALRATAAPRWRLRCSSRCRSNPAGYVAPGRGSRPMPRSATRPRCSRRSNAIWARRDCSGGIAERRRLVPAQAPRWVRGSELVIRSIAKSANAAETLFAKLDRPALGNVRCNGRQAPKRTRDAARPYHGEPLAGRIAKLGARRARSRQADGAPRASGTANCRWARGTASTASSGCGAAARSRCWKHTCARGADGRWCASRSGRSASNTIW